MQKRHLLLSTCVCVVLATLSTSLLGQSGRMHHRRVAPNDLSRDEKQRPINSKPKSEPQPTVKDEVVTAAPNETTGIQAQRWTDQDVVSIIIVTALVLIVLVGLRRT